MSVSTTARLFSCVLAWMAAGGGVPGLAAEAATFSGPQSAGQLEATPRREASGLAASRRSPGVWWLHDDSGGPPVLYAVDSTGKKVGAVRLTETKNNDWEDLAAFTSGGKSWLLVADTGDNGGDRKTLQLHVVEEPARSQLSPERETPLAPAWTIRVRYPDGAHDCEAVAVDADEGAVYLLTKRDALPRLYRVPLARADSPVAAQFVGTAALIGNGGMTDDMLKNVLGKKVHWPTAMDFAPDGSAALVLTYGEVLLFPRRRGETWAAALGRAPQHLGFHALPQAEGAAFSADGTELRVISENSTEFFRFVRK